MATEYKEVYRVLKQFAENVKEDFRDELIRHRKNGKLDKTIQIDVKSVGEDYTITIRVEDYWKYIESGRKPGTFPNLGAIIKWIRVKKILPRNSKEVKTEKQLAYLIGRAIKKRGIKPLPLLDKAIDKNVKDLYKEMAKALQTDVEVILSNLFNNK